HEEGGSDRLAGGGHEALMPLGYRFFPQHAWSNEFRLSSPLVRGPLKGRVDLVAARPAREGDAAVLVLGPGGTRREYPLGPGADRVLAVSADAAFVLTTQAPGDGSVSLRLHQKGELARTLATLNTHLRAVVGPARQAFNYALKDPERREGSRQIEGCVLLPPGHVSGARYPLLLDIYPTGRGGSCSTLADAPYPGSVVPDLWATKGFVYMRPALPLDFARTGAGPLEGLGDLVDQTIDALVAEGLVDPGRIVFYGSSQGGAASLMAAAQSGRASAVISMNGWADFFSHYYGARGLMRYFHLDQNGGDNRWRYECEMPGDDHYCPFGFGVSAAGAPGLYARTSPVARAGDMTAPVMLVHTDLDYFDMAQYDEMFGALYRAGKEAIYVRYWGEGHGLSSPPNIRDLWQRIDRFLTGAGVLDVEGSESSPGLHP
ncbi:MAG: hypothetical protein WA989_06220, partial [Henriciella sp.]|uniref:alpha/beta hydrolase family protein n=1 Tax=Henriciella sp. TaxID=1968823 RepID=UPI003C70E611